MCEQSYAHLADLFKPKADNFELPMVGYYKVHQWAARFDMTEKQFRIWIDQYQIPYFKPGREMVIRAEDFWASVPRVDHRPQPTTEESDE